MLWSSKTHYKTVKLFLRRKGNNWPKSAFHKPRQYRITVAQMAACLPQVDRSWVRIPLDPIRPTQRAIVVTPSRWTMQKGDQILGPAKYQSPPKSYIARPRQVSKATPPLSWSNHREKFRRKAERKKNKTMLRS